MNSKLFDMQRYVSFRIDTTFLLHQRKLCIWPVMWKDQFLRWNLLSYWLNFLKFNPSLIKIGFWLHKTAWMDGWMHLETSKLTNYFKFKTARNFLAIWKFSCTEVSFNLCKKYTLAFSFKKKFSMFAHNFLNGSTVFYRWNV